MRVLVVDDEPLARRRLVKLLRAIDGVELAGEAGDGEAALAQIATNPPDVVLLDIRMPGIDGVSLALQNDDLPPIIFTTAYSTHAVEAFEANAVDYLLKPIQSERLERALARVRSRPAAESERLAMTLRDVLRQSEAVPRVTARSGDTIHVFDARSITRFHAADKYTVFLARGSEYLAEEGLSELEARLSDHGFVRTHRSELVQLDRICSLRSEDDRWFAELDDGQVARVSRRLLAEVKRRLGA